MFLNSNTYFYFFFFVRFCSIDLIWIVQHPGPLHRIRLLPGLCLYCKCFLLYITWLFGVLDDRNIFFLTFYSNCIGALQYQAGNCEGKNYIVSLIHSAFESLRKRKALSLAWGGSNSDQYHWLSTLPRWSSLLLNLMYLRDCWFTFLSRARRKTMISLKCTRLENASQVLHVIFLVDHQMMY